MRSEVHERLHLISRARTIATWPGIGLVALMAWTVAGSSSLEPGVPVCLCMPPAALWLVHRWPALFTLWARRTTDIRLSLSVALIAGVAVPIGVALKIVNVANPSVLVLPALVVGALTASWALKTDPALRKRPWDVAKVALCLVSWGGALVFWLDHALPPLEEHRAVVTVTDLRMNREHKRFTTFHARATPAPTTEDWDDYRIPHDDWQRLRVGAPACIDERRGLFGVTEAAISACPAGAPAS